jgi:hypothetical protein
MYFGLKVGIATILLILSAQHACTAITIGAEPEDEWPHSPRPEADRFVLCRGIGRELRKGTSSSPRGPASE